MVNNRQQGNEKNNIIWFDVIAHELCDDKTSN